MAWQQLEKFGQIECAILPDNIWSEKSSDRNTHTGGTNLVNYPNNTIIYQSDNIVIHKGSVGGFSGSNNSLYVRTRRSGGSGWDAPVYVGSADNSYYGHSEVYVSAVIDKDNQIGALALTCHNNYSGYWSNGASAFDSSNNFTNAIYLDLLNEYPKYAGGAGSGYIGNPLLSNKKMVGYNVPTSSSADTKTLSTDTYNSVATYDVPKEGNGYARIRYLGEPGRKIKTLIDASENIKDTIFDNIVTIPSNDFGNDTWQFDQNGILFINEKNRNRASINAKFFKGSATKLYIEVLYNHRSTYGSNYRFEFMFLDDLYSGECIPSDYIDYIPFISHTNQYNIIDNDPWYDLPKTVIEISLSNIPINQIFYISFASCDGHTEISKIYFDDNAYIIQ